MFLQILPLLLDLHDDLIALFNLPFEGFNLILDHVDVALISGFDPHLLLFALNSLGHHLPILLVELYLLALCLVQRFQFSIDRIVYYS